MAILPDFIVKPAPLEEMKHSFSAYLKHALQHREITLCIQVWWVKTREHT